MRRINAAGPQQGFLAVRDRLAGRVLEIGCGTGTAFDDYPAGVRVVAIDRDREFLGLARDHTGTAAARIDVVAADATRLSFEDDAFDAAVVQLALCCIADPHAALAEITRVVRRGGLLYFYEHVIGQNRMYRMFQNATAPLWRRISEGCHWNRDTAATIRSMPLEIESEQRSHLRRPWMPPLPIVRIVATRR